MNQINSIELRDLCTISIAFPVSDTNLETKQLLTQDRNATIVQQKERPNLDILPTEELLSLVEKVNKTYLECLQNTKEVQLQTIILMLSLSLVQ